MKEIEITSTALYYIVEKIKEEASLGYINNVQTIESKENLIKLKIHKQHTKEIIITPKTLFLSKHNLPVSSTPNGLIKFLKKKLYNQRIQEITQDKNNRVVYFRLDDYYLIFEFFSNSNIILTDLEHKVITSKQKEEWKDRIIKKHEKYEYPQNKDIKTTTKETLLEETKEEDLKKTISYFVKEYNISPLYLNKKTKEEVIEATKEIYNLKEPELYLEETETKKIVLVKESKNSNDFFFPIIKHYLEDIEINSVKEEITKKQKQKSILESQLETKEEYQKLADTLEKEGELIYANFQTIEKINQQINIAREKKIPEEEIINKLNDYFNKFQKNIKILKINLKDKTYTLEIS